MKANTRILIIALFALVTTFANAGVIGNGGYVITKPGKYSLIRNIAVKALPHTTQKFGISILANDVDLDLNGFTIGPAVGAPGEGFAILLGDGVKRVRIHDGRIQGTFCGIQSVPNSTQDAFVVERMHISGCASYSLSLSVGADWFGIVSTTTVTDVPSGGNGIVLKLGAGSFAVVRDCSVHGKSGSGEGITSEGTDGLIVQHCHLFGLDKGIVATAACKIIDNTTLGCTTPFSGSPVMVGTNN